MPKRTYAELFAGAGGMSLGLEAAGWHCVAHAEIEPHARAVLRKHWPDVPLHGDVSELDGAQFQGITMLTGGSPCQDLSIAGKRKGLEGERSGLFHQQVRIWRESGAPYILWENVLGALSSNKGEDFGVVLSTIVGGAVPVPADGWRGAGVASGPAGVAAWRVLDAQFFGVPQRRRRVFVLGVADGSVDPAEVLSLGEGVSGHPAPRREAGEGIAADAGAGVEGAIQFTPGNLIRRAGPNPSMDGVSQTLGAYTQGDQAPHVVWFSTTAIGNQTRGVVLDVAIPIDTRNATRTTDKDEQNPQGLGVGEDGDLSPTLTGLFTPAVLTYDTRGNGDGQVVNTMAGDHQNRVTDYTAIVLRNREGKPGGGKGPLLSTERKTTLGTANDQVVFAHVGIPRRLTPTECERLMGWEDGWTAHGIDEQGREYRLKDTPRYKLCGNGIASPVVQWIGWRLKVALDNAQPSV